MRTFKKKPPVWLGVAVMLLLLAGASLYLGGRSRDALYGNEKAQLELSGLNASGVVRARYLAGGDRRIKLRITRTGGRNYHYDLNTAGDWQQYTLTQGDGEYAITVYEQVEDTRYTPVLTHTVTLELDDPAAPFLQSGPFVSFTSDSAAAALAGELTDGMDSDGEKIDAVFDYVTEHLSYDELRSATAEPGYLPDVDAVLQADKGICLDYAALMSAMLRSQGVPCKLLVGYAGSVYHAWVEVPDGAGGWKRMDPTFVSGRGNTPEMAEYVADDANYRTVYVY